VLSHLPPQCKTRIFFSSWGFDQAVFLVINLLTAVLTNSSVLFVQNFVLIGYRINSTNAVVCEMLMFPADHSKRTGMSGKSTFHKFSGESGKAGVLKRNNFAGASSTSQYELSFHYTLKSLETLLCFFKFDKTRAYISAILSNFLET